MSTLSRVAYIVIPPGHGKSTIHEREEGLVEADTVVNNKETEVLSLLRKTAKESKNWELYDKEWSREVEEKLPKGRVVVMVPHKGVGESRGWTYLGSGLLVTSVAEKNFLGRGDALKDYEECIKDAAWGGAVVFGSNEELEWWARGVCIGWKGHK